MSKPSEGASPKPPSPTPCHEEPNFPQQTDTEPQEPTAQINALASEDWADEEALTIAGTTSADQKEEEDEGEEERASTNEPTPSADQKEEEEEDALVTSEGIHPLLLLYMSVLQLKGGEHGIDPNTPAGAAKRRGVEIMRRAVEGDLDEAWRPNETCPPDEPSSSPPTPLDESADAIAESRVWKRVSLVATAIIVLFLAALTVPYDTSLTMALMAEPDGYPTGECGIKFTGHVPYLYVLDDSQEIVEEKISFPVVEEATGFHWVQAPDQNVRLPNRVCVLGLSRDVKEELFCFQDRAAQCVFSVVQNIHTHILKHVNCLSSLKGCM
jgi:hypothetical protein